MEVAMRITRLREVMSGVDRIGKIPIARRTETNPNRGDAGMARLRPLIMVIDDDRALTRLISRHLRMAGYRVMTAANGGTAVRLIHQERPALVLMDVPLGRAGAFEGYHSIREVSTTPIMTVMDKNELEKLAHEVDFGAEECVTKPINVDALVARVRAVLSRTRFRIGVDWATSLSGQPTRDPASVGL
jgi:DNA-binding response OmpR family regulator